MCGISFECASGRELDAVLGLYRSAIGREGCTWSREYPNEFDAVQDIETGNLFVLKIDGEVIGAASVVPENELDDINKWHVRGSAAREIARVTIRSEYSRKGYARLMLEKLFERLSERNVNSVHLLVAKCNKAALSLYRSTGFVFLGECRRYGHDFYICERVERGSETSNTSYSTKIIADSIGIHVNTVRFYEKIGFITKPVRKPNGYRIYTDLQLVQCRLIRLAMRAEILQNGLRDKAAEIIRHCAELDFNAAENALSQYRKMLASEISGAEAARRTAEGILRTDSPNQTEMTRSAAAGALGVTPETLRTWERSGLIGTKRLENGYRVYSADDIARLNVIRTLRCAGYSLMSILRLMNGFDRNNAASVDALLDTPGENEEIVSVCDRLTVSLLKADDDAETMLPVLKETEKIFTTIQ